MSPRNVTRRRFLLGAGAVVGLSAGAAPFVLSLRPETRLHARRFFALGTRVTLLVRHADEVVARRAMRSAMREIYSVHEAATLFEPSPLVHLNAAGHARPVALPGLLLALLDESRALTRRTEGLFDASIGALTRARREAGTHRTRPQGYRDTGRDALELDPIGGTARLTRRAVAYDLNAVAKGFAVDRASERLRAAGIRDFLVNAGGDIYAAGREAAGEDGWTLRIADPERPSRSVKRLVVSDRGVATSGNYRQRRLADGSRFCHLIDPRLGLPSEDAASATVVAPSCTEADAWATAAFVGGSAEAGPLVAAHPALQAWVVERSGALRTL